jgi:dephospho-CoA kinase
MLADLGAAIVDADAISRSLTTPGGAAIPAIAAFFGRAYISPDGALDRTQMRERVFCDPAAKQQLEAIIHPLVVQIALAQATAAQSAQRPCVVFDVPLLVEAQHWRARLRQVIVVDCESEVQISRVEARSSLSRNDIQNIMAAQASRAQRLAAADIVLFNQDLPLPALQVEVAQLYAHLVP